MVLPWKDFYLKILKIKIIVFKKRRRQNQKRYGHRQLLSKVQITKILKGGKVVSEIKEDKIKLSNELKSDKKDLLKKKKFLKSLLIKNQQLKQKVKSKKYGNKKSRWIIKKWAR